jgi:hypothetical protein
MIQRRTLACTCLALTVLWFGAGACKKQQPVRLDPHSSEAVLLTLIAQGKLLSEAAARNDLKYVHDYTYYFNGLAQTLSSKLNEQQKLRLRPVFDELSTITEQLDHASGRRHLEATQASLNQLQAKLKELERQYREMNPSDKKPA